MKPVARLIYSASGESDREFLLAEGSVNIGRGATNEIVLHDPRVSRVHARIQCGPDGCVVTDLGSANGTLVNAARVERATIKPGDVLTLGGSALRVAAAGGESEPEITPIHDAADLDATLVETSVETALTDTSTAHLVAHTPDHTWRVALEKDAVTIGRSPDNDVDLDFPEVSRHHARVERQGDGFLVRDLKSRNGTFIGAQRIDARALHDGDSIRIGPAQLLFKGGFESEDLTIVEPPKSIAAGRPPVVIVPGLLGTELWAGSTRVWPNVRLLFTQPDLFRLPGTENIEPRGLIQEVVVVPNLIKLDQYNRLGGFLEEALGYERGKDLFEFGWDWRQDLRLSAGKLAEAIEAWNLKPPIILIGHSLGCLVARYYVQCLGGKEKVGRLALLGSPNAGNPSVLTALLAGPNLLPFGIMGEKLRALLATFPSLYQAIPPYAVGVDQAGKPVDFLQDSTWLAEERRPLLLAAREFWRDVGSRSSVPTVSIFGYGIKTMTAAAIEREENGLCRKLTIGVEPKGDDSIPEKSGVLPGTDIHPVQQHHGSLYVDNDVKMRLKVELTRGLE